MRGMNVRFALKGATGIRPRRNGTPLKLAGGCWAFVGIMILYPVCQGGVSRCIRSAAYGGTRCSAALAAFYARDASEFLHGILQP